MAGGLGIGGAEVGSAELYDPESEVWTPTGSHVTARDTHTATSLPNGKVIVAGGDGTAGPLASSELYDAVTGMWSPTGSMPNARYYHTATLLPKWEGVSGRGRQPWRRSSRYRTL